MVKAQKGNSIKSFTCKAWDLMRDDKNGWVLVEENCPDVLRENYPDSPILPASVHVTTLKDCNGNDV